MARRRGQTAYEAEAEADRGDDPMGRVERLATSAPAGNVRTSFWASLPTLIWIGLFSLLINLLMLTGPIFMLQVYDRVLPSRSLPTLMVLAALVGLLFLIFGLLECVRTRLLARLGVSVVQRLRARLVEGVVWLGVRMGGAPGAMRPLRDLDLVQSYYSGPAFAFRFDVPWAPIYLAAITLMHPWLGAYGVLAILLLVPIALLFHRRAQAPLTDAEKATRQLQAVADTARRNAEACAAMGMLGALEERWMAAHDKALIDNTRARDRMGTLGAGTRSLRLALQSGILAIGAWLVIRGEISAGSMVAASIILGRALQPVDQFIAHLRIRGQFREARRRIDDFFGKLPHTRRHTAPVKTSGGHMDVKRLAVFPPGASRPVLVGMNFFARSGRITVIEGPNGVGKTCLLRVLIGVWQTHANAGTVTLDGATFDQWPPDRLGQLIGYLPQDVELLDGTIKDNIARFEIESDEDKVRHAAELAGADAMIRAIGGYDLYVGAGGARLSAGQRQRIALARALYGDPVLLVLDEPNAALDREAERSLVQTLIALREEGKTIVLTDHGGVLGAVADDLLLLGFDNEGIGRQIAFGTPKEVDADLERLRAREGGGLGGGPRGAEAGPRGQGPGGFHVIYGRSPKAPGGNR